MKTISRALFLAVILAGVSSCGGWSKTQEEEFMTACEESGSFDCKCALETTKKAYPNCSDFNATKGKDDKLSKELIENCMK